jgi:hypothetical protein
LAFQKCENLTFLTLPPELTSIGVSAFIECNNLTAIQVDAANRFYAERDGVLFNKTFTELIRYPPGKTAPDYTVPGSVTGIGENAFHGCKNLVSIHLPEGLTKIGGSAFSGCNNLAAIQADKANRVYAERDGVLFNKTFTELIRYPPGRTAPDYTVPDSVTCIGGNAFTGCGSLASIYLPAGLAGIVDTIPVFSWCHSLAAIHVDKANSFYADRDGILFNKDFTGLIKYPAKKPAASYAIPDSVIYIGQWAFFWCESLAAITLPDGLTSIGEAAFSKCTSMGSITMQALTPPALTGNGRLWYPQYASPAAIYVPSAALNDYRNAPGWKSYAGRIQPAGGVS